MKKIIFLMLFATVGWQHALAQSFTDGGMNYEVTSPTTVSVGYQNGAATGNVTIPSQVTNNGDVYWVTSIGDGAFDSCPGLTSVTIPNSVTSIGDYAFYLCSGLTSITIPNSVTSIGEAAFASCFGLTSFTIPNSVTSIGDWAFYHCSGLSSVTISNSLTSIGNYAFIYCSGLTSVTIPNSVTSIGAFAFRSCSGLTSVTISNSLTSIGQRAFYNCYGLTSVTIPSSVTSIGDYAFFNCYGLTSMICNISTPLSINENVFDGVNHGACSLIVPNGSIAAYMATSVWQNFMVLIPTTKVRASQCGGTLTAINSQIAADIVTGAQIYRFEVTNGSTVNTFETTKRNFSLIRIAGTTYATTYSIKVAVKINGVWGNYGQACSVTTPALSVSTVLTTRIRSTFCGTTLAALNTKIPALTVFNAEGYRFEITAAGVTTVYDSALYNFRLSDAGIVALSGTTYAIRVAAKVNGIYGNYGTSCNVTTPGVGSTSRQMAETTSIETIDFSLVAYPNPSNSTFKLQVNFANDDSLSILVFDMMGRQIENKLVNANDIENISIGQNYSTGIYNVIVSQGMNTKTVRLVKN